MKREQLSNRIGNIEDRLVEQAENAPNFGRQRRNHSIRRMVSIAAVLALMVASFAAGAIALAKETIVYVEKAKEIIEVGNSGITLILPDTWKDKYEYVLHDSGVNADGIYINLSVIHSATRERLEYEAGVLFSIHFTDERRPMDYIWPWPGFTIAVTETGTFHLIYPSDVQFDESDPETRAEYEELSADIRNIRIIMSTEMLANTMNASNWVQGTMFIDYLENWQVVKSVVCDVEQSQIIRSIIESQDYREPGSFHVDLRFMVDKDEYFMNSKTGEIMLAAGGYSAVISAGDLNRIMDLLGD